MEDSIGFVKGRRSADNKCGCKDEVMVVEVCKSDKKGSRKQAVSEGTLKENYGLVGDAHADSHTHRQVSLLAAESIAKMQGRGLNLSPGDFAENITCEGLVLAALPVGTRLSIGGEAVLEITQIGKECHHGCAIRRQIGTCVMPTEGIFTRVVKGGPVRRGDVITILDGVRVS